MSIAVVGAGSIGCYLGLRLAHAGEDVRFLARESLVRATAERGLALTDFDGESLALPPAKVEISSALPSIAGVSEVLVCVKSQDSAAVAAELAPHLAPGVTVFSFQNGVRNRDALAACLPRARVVSTMVPFNVVREAPTRFRRTTEGAIVVEDVEPGRVLVERLRRAGIPAATHTDLEAVQWGKLLMNLNNALNALSGRPLVEQLADRDHRAVLARMVAEGLTVLDAAGIVPARVGKVPPRRIPFLLGLPNPIFRVVARGMLKMDPEARSSMWEDLVRGRSPEIDYLNGEIVALAKRHGFEARANACVVELVREAFRVGAGSWPGMSGREIRERI